MYTTSLLDILYEEYAEYGKVNAQRNLYPRQTFELLDNGFDLERLRTTPESPNQSLYLISWKRAKRGTVAYRYLQKAAEIHPELLQGEA